VRDVEELIPGFRDIAFRKSRLLECLDAVIAAAAAVASVFSPFVFTGKAASTKTLSFWQFYAPARQLDIQSKWFEDCVKGWNATHDLKVDLQYVPAQDYIGGSKLQTAFASGQGPDIFIISPGDFLRYYNGGVLVDLTPYVEDAAKKDFFPNVMETRIVDEKIYGIPFDVVPLAMFSFPPVFRSSLRLMPATD
jgi:multiple sugar transport system substrate-binding protein